MEGGEGGVVTKTQLRYDKHHFTKQTRQSCLPLYMHNLIHSHHVMPSHTSLFIDLVLKIANEIRVQSLPCTHILLLLVMHITMTYQNHVHKLLGVT